MSEKNILGQSPSRPWPWIAVAVAAALIALNPLIRLKAMSAPVPGILIGAAAVLVLTFLAPAVLRPLRTRASVIALTMAAGLYLLGATFVNGLYMQRWVSYVQQTELLPAVQILEENGYLPDTEVRRLEAAISDEDYLISSVVSAAHVLKRSQVAGEAAWREALADRLERASDWERSYYRGFLEWAREGAEWPTQAPDAPTIKDLAGVPVIWELGARSIAWMHTTDQLAGTRGGR